MLRRKPTDSFIMCFSLACIYMPESVYFINAQDIRACSLNPRPETGFPPNISTGPDRILRHKMGGIAVPASAPNIDLSGYPFFEWPDTRKQNRSVQSDMQGEEMGIYIFYTL